MAVIDKTESHRVHVPHEQSEANGGPHWMEIRYLSGSEMDGGKEAHLISIMESMGSYMKDLKQDQQQEDRLNKDDLEVRRAVYDPGILINLAVVGWSYSVPIENPGKQLDAVTRDWLWSLIVDENTRPPASSLSGEHSLS